MEENPRSETQQMLRALGQPLRREILRQVSEEDPSSPCEIAKALGARLSNVSYHTQVLVECGALEPTGVENAQGATKHFYQRICLPKWVRMLLGERDD